MKNDLHLFSSGVITTTVIYKDQSIQIKAKSNLTLNEFKHIAMNKLNLTQSEMLYLFYNHLHVSSKNYGNSLLAELLFDNSVSQLSDINLFYLINIEDYRNMACKFNFVFCNEHIMNRVHLYCSKCATLICDLCLLSVHKDHKSIEDPILIHDSYSNKISGIQKMVHLQKNIPKDLREETVILLIQKLNIDLEVYLKEEKERIQASCTKLKDLIDSIQSAEESRLIQIVEKSKEMIYNIKDDASKIRSLYSTLNIKSSSSLTEATQKRATATNHEIKDSLNALHNNFFEVLINESKFKYIVKKMNCVFDKDFKYSELLSKSKDETFWNSCKSISEMISIALSAVNLKYEEEDYNHILNKMERLFFGSSEAENMIDDNLNINNTQNSKIYHTIDDSDIYISFCTETRKIERHKAEFNGKMKKLTHSQINKILTSLSLGKLVPKKEENIKTADAKLSTDKFNVKKSSKLKAFGQAIVNKVSLFSKGLNFGGSQLGFLNLIEESSLIKFPKYSRCISIKDKLYITGGEEDIGVTNYFLVMIPDNDNRVLQLKNMFFSHAGPSLFNYNNSRLYVVSGAYDQKSCEFYNLSKGNWEQIAPVNRARVGANVICLNNKYLYLFLGKNWDVKVKNWVFEQTFERLKINNIEEGEADMIYKWEEINFKSHNNAVHALRAFGCCTALIDSSLIVIGGHCIKPRQLPIMSAREEKYVVDDSQFADICLKIDFSNNSIHESELKFEKASNFLIPNFYHDSFNMFSIDYEGDIIIHSTIYTNIWVLSD